MAINVFYEARFILRLTWLLWVFLVASAAAVVLGVASERDPVRLKFDVFESNARPEMRSWSECKTGHGDLFALRSYQTPRGNPYYMLFCFRGAWRWKDFGPDTYARSISPSKDNEAQVDAETWWRLLTAVGLFAAVGMGASLLLWYVPRVLGKIVRRKLGIPPERDTRP